MMFKRRRKLKTDYRQRIGLLKSGKPRLVVRRYHNTFVAQIVEYQPGKTDLVKTTVISRHLRKYGWDAHGGNTPSGYLVGYLIGKKALEMGISEAVPDIGLHISSRGSSIYAVILGARHAGLNVPMDESMMPEERARGEHIKSFTGKDIPSLVDEVKNKIDAEFKG